MKIPRFQPPANQVLVVCGFLLLAVLAVFGQTIRHEFVNFDDADYVIENPPVSGGLSAEGICWAFTRVHSDNWHPLTWLSLMVDCQFYGLNAGGHHLTNVLLHAATAVLLFLVLHAMTGRLWPSALAAALFAVHPLRAESVAWVTERKDVLSGLFFVLTLAAYVGYVHHRFSLVRYLVVVVVFALGLMAKPMLVTLPLVLLLLDYWPLGRMAVAPGGHAAVLQARRSGRFSLLARLVLEKVPLLALAVISCVVTVWAQREGLDSIGRLPLWWRIGNALISYATYLGQGFYPVGMAAFYPRLSLELPLGKVFGAFVVLLGITATVLLGRRRRPYLLVGWLWYLGTLVPVIGLLQQGAQARADRYTYLPQIGLYLALAWGVADVCRAWPYRRWVSGMASALVLTILMGCAWRQTSFWRQSETLWTHALACTSRNHLAHGLLGMALAGRGQFDGAIAHYHEALRIQPNFASAHFGLGNALATQGRIDEAIVHYRKALEIRPDHADTHYDLAVVLASCGRFDEALGHFRQSLAINPNSADVHINLGNVLERLGRFDEAMSQYRQALKIQPDFVEAQKNLAWLRATCPQASLRNGAEAMTLAERANRLCGGQRSDVLDTLAAAYAEAGWFPEAHATARKALELAIQQHEAALVDALRARIACYDAGKPYRETPPVPAPSSRKP